LRAFRLVEPWLMRATSVDNKLRAIRNRSAGKAMYWYKK
jgi:hypothetical protein